MGTKALLTLTFTIYYKLISDYLSKAVEWPTICKDHSNEAMWHT